MLSDETLPEASKVPASGSEMQRLVFCFYAVRTTLYYAEVALTRTNKTTPRPLNTLLQSSRSSGLHVYSDRYSIIMQSSTSDNSSQRRHREPLHFGRRFLAKTQHLPPPYVLFQPLAPIMCAYVRCYGCRMLPIPSTVIKRDLLQSVLGLSGFGALHG